jgi:hypothetical protein
MKYKNRTNYAYAGLIVVSAFGVSACNGTSSISASVSTSASGDLMATISTSLDTSAYGLAELNIPVVDPKTSEEYGVINITPTVCSPAATSCASGGTLNLSLDLSSFVHLNSVSSTLPNGTAFPVSFPSSSTVVYATTIGSGGAKVYGAIGGGTYLIGAAVPYSGLNGPGSYTPGIDVFGTVTSNNVTTYIGYFAGAANTVDQTGVAVFADLSSVINALVAKSGVEANAVAQSVESLGGAAKAASVAQPNSGSVSDQNAFIYNLWKNGQEKHTVLQYQ